MGVCVPPWAIPPWVVPPWANVCHVCHCGLVAYIESASVGNASVGEVVSVDEGLRGPMPPWAVPPCAHNALPEEDGRIRKGAYAIRWHKPHLAVSNTRPLPCMRESIKTSPWTMASVGQGLHGPSSSLVTCHLVTAYLVRSRRPRTGAVIRHVAFRLLEVVHSARARRRRQSTSTFSG